MKLSQRLVLFMMVAAALVGGCMKSPYRTQYDSLQRAFYAAVLDPYGNVVRQHGPVMFGDNQQDAHEAAVALLPQFQDLSRKCDDYRARFAALAPGPEYQNLQQGNLQLMDAWKREMDSYVAYLQFLASPLPVDARQLRTLSYAIHTSMEQRIGLLKQEDAARRKIAP